MIYTETLAPLSLLADKDDSSSSCYVPAFHAPLSLLSSEQLMQVIERSHEQMQKRLIQFLTLDHLWMAQHCPEYRENLWHRADITLVDSIPVRWLTALTGLTLPERVTRAGVIRQLCAQATEFKQTLFILGSDSLTLRLAKSALRHEGILPDTVTCWTEARHKLEKPIVNEMLLQALHRAFPDILFVAWEDPWASYWIHDNWDKLPLCPIVSVGDAFEEIAGMTPPTPQWLQKLGLQWLVHLLLNWKKRERSLFERYIVTDLPFACQLFWHVLRKPTPNHRLTKSVG